MKLTKISHNNVKLPNGYILKNSSNPIPKFKFNHPFDGHGYINKFHIHDNDVYYSGIRVETSHYLEELNQNKIIYRGFATSGTNNLFFNNFSNISLLNYNNKVYSLSEGGLPYEIDIENETTIGVNNFGIKFFDKLPFFPATVHPKVLNDNVYNASCFGVGLLFYNNTELIFKEIFPNMQQYYFHEFYVTENYYIFYLNSINLDFFNIYIENKPIFDNLKFEKKSKILLVNRQTLQKQYVCIPDEFNFPVMHIAHAEEKDKQINIYVPLLCEQNDFKIHNVTDMSHSQLHKFTVTNNIICCEAILNAIGEMPIYYNSSIFLINKNILRVVNVEDNSIKKHVFKNVIEEPVIKDNFMFIICHDIKTHLYVIDLRKMCIINEYCMEKQISQGFHGLFLSKSNSFNTSN